MDVPKRKSVKTRRAAPRPEQNGTRRLRSFSSASSRARGVDLGFARQVIASEARAVAALKRCVNADFRKAAEWILKQGGPNGGRVVATGMGKAGIVAQKVCATLASTGTPALFMHPAEAMHGDLGMVTGKDVLLAFSNSGDSEEVVRLLPTVKKMRAKVVAITGNRNSPLARTADVVLDLGKIVEPCPLRLAPSASTTAMLALGDALALCVLKARGFTANDFAQLHPGGALGRKLLRAADLMRRGPRLPLARPADSVRSAIAKMTKARGGAVVIVDGKKRLLGILTDGDFRRTVMDNKGAVDEPVAKHMTSPCTAIRDDTLVAEAQEIVAERRINALPVVNRKRVVVGLLDIQDLVAWPVL
ncbi:MAG: KpsF/GutQ family sugar-phosphate isomerase [Planctomycetes bacterium]|nr:KpsF/GutQ family sugar-phosphate isomerase [Planctomycetota bacterium]